MILSLNKENEMNAKQLQMMFQKLNSIGKEVKKMNHLLSISIPELARYIPGSKASDNITLIDIIKYCYIRVKMLTVFLENDRKRLLLTSGMYSSLLNQIKNVESRLNYLYKHKGPRPNRRKLKPSSSTTLRLTQRHARVITSKMTPMPGRRTT